MLNGFNSGFAPCKGIQDSLGFWIPRHGFRIPGTGFQSLSVEPGFWIPIASGVADSLSCIPDAKARDSGFHMQIFSGFRILQAQTSRIGAIWIESTHTGCGMQKATIGSGWRDWTLLQWSHWFTDWVELGISYFKVVRNLPQASQELIRSQLKIA